MVVVRLQTLPLRSPKVLLDESLCWAPLTPILAFAGRSTRRSGTQQWLYVASSTGLHINQQILSLYYLRTCRSTRDVEVTYTRPTLSKIQYKASHYSIILPADVQQISSPAPSQLSISRYVGHAYKVDYLRRRRRLRFPRLVRFVPR
jgi:hypothetical protein